MKTAALALGLFVGFTQTISFTNCCQGTLCSQKDNCPACPENRDSSSDDCCGKGTVPKTGEPSCVHLEPSMEVDSGVMPDHDFPAGGWVELLAEAAFLDDAAVADVTRIIAPQGTSPPESPPLLYLRNLALLI